MNQYGIKIKVIITGLMAVAAGVLLYLFNSGVLPIEYKFIVFSWQMLLIVMGFIGLFSRHKWFGGLLLIILGVFFLLPKFDIEALSFLKGNGWSIALIFIGILILFKGLWGRSFRYEKDCEERVKRKMNRHQDRFTNRGEDMKKPGYIERNFVFGGSKEKLDTKDFKGGEINCIFSGMELDLTGARLAEGVHILEVNSVFGGVILYIPIDWKIEVRQSQFFGSFVDNRPKPSFEIDENRVLIIEASVVFGGGEIKLNRD